MAVVIPYPEYAERLAELNMTSYEHWRQESRSAQADGRCIPDFVSLSDLPWELLEADPRVCLSGSAWDALTNSAETAARLCDNAPAECYIPLTDTAWPSL